MTAAFGRDQSYLEQPWISKWSIAIDSLGVSPFDFSVGQKVKERLYESGRAAATEYLDSHSLVPGPWSGGQTPRQPASRAAPRRTA